MPWEKQFDVDAALERAGEAFWANGYEATSVRDLLNTMGIQKGSFYDTYGSKKTAYLMALRQYMQRLAADFQEGAEQQTPHPRAAALYCRSFELAMFVLGFAHGSPYSNDADAVSIKVSRGSIMSCKIG